MVSGVEPKYLRKNLLGQTQVKLALMLLWPI